MGAAFSSHLNPKLLSIPDRIGPKRGGAQALEQWQELIELQG